jgi:hypothetical protein
MTTCTNNFYNASAAESFRVQSLQDCKHKDKAATDMSFCANRVGIALLSGCLNVSHQAAHKSTQTVTPTTTRLHPHSTTESSSHGTTCRLLQGRITVILEAIEGKEVHIALESVCHT